MVAKIEMRAIIKKIYPQELIGTRLSQAAQVVF